jgi:uncharacterized membrane protein
MPERFCSGIPDMEMNIHSVQHHALPRQTIGQWASIHWLGIFLTVYSLWIFTPFLAPVFMLIGWTGVGKGIYFIYSFFCHQLPERSFFFFGQKTMYSLSQIQAAWQNTVNPMILRQFIGNESMGWKVAWSDRMISFYSSVWLLAIVWMAFRKTVKPLSILGFALLLLPMALDGGTHLLSDFAGIGQGFRDTNQWLAILTNHTLSDSFLIGDALGSFNSLARIITGFLAGLGVVWLAFPHLEESFGKN